MNIKRLNLPSWFVYELTQNISEEEQEHLDKYYPKISPIIGKNGWYSKGKFSWGEYNGQARQMDYNMFVFDLRILIVSEIDIKTIRALQAISKTKYCTKSQRRLVFDYDTYLMLFNQRQRFADFRRSLHAQKNNY